MAGFSDYTKAELLRVLDEYFPEIDVNKSQSKDRIVATLLEQGLDFDTFKAYQQEGKEEPEEEPKAEAPVEKAPEEEKKTELLYFLGRSYHTDKYTFTRRDPFGFVTTTDAEALLKTDQFRRANTKEIEEFYS